MDYVDKLSEKEKEWLSNFNEEFVGASFQHPGKVLHKTKAAKRDCYGRNNARNRCLYTLNRTRGWTAPTESREAFDPIVENPHGHEDMIIDLMETKDVHQANLLSGDQNTDGDKDDGSKKLRPVNKRR